MQHRRERSHCVGFTLIDVMIATVIIGLAVVSMMTLFTAGTQSQHTALQTTVALRLAKDVYEYSLTLPHVTVPGTGINDIADLNGQTFGRGGVASSSVVGSTGNAIPGFSDWAQTVQVKDVDPGTLQDTSNSTVPERPKRLIVSVKFRNQVLFTQRWLVAPMLQH
jgi:type II secretory pathway pseudopilin PulG